MIEVDPNIEIKTSAILYNCCNCSWCGEKFQEIGKELEKDEKELKEIFSSWSEIAEHYGYLLTLSMVIFSWLSYIVAYGWLSILIPDANLAVTYWLSELFLTGLIGGVHFLMTLIRWNKYYIAYWLIILFVGVSKFAFYMLCVVFALPYYYSGKIDGLWSGKMFGAGFGTLLGVSLVIFLCVAISIHSYDKYNNTKKQLVNAEIETRKRNRIILENKIKLKADSEKEKSA